MASIDITGITFAGENKNKNQYSEAAELARINDLSQRYRDAINTQYAAGIQNLQTQKDKAYVNYDPLRASVNAEYSRGLRANNENMANLGLTRSGTNLTAQLKLDTERQRGIADVNAQQAEAERKLQEQITTYIAERDSAIAKTEADLYSNAYNNISAHERQLAQMEVQHGYNVQMAELNNRFNREMAALEYEYSLAISRNDHQQQAALQREMAALEQSYKMQTMERQAQLERESYEQRAASDWNYYQQQAALDNSYDWNNYQQKAALDYSYDAALQQLKNQDTFKGKNIYSVSDLDDDAKALYYTHNERIRKSKAINDTSAINGNSAIALKAIGGALDQGMISETEADFLIRLWGLN
jgi:hypothetical protein